MRAFGYTTKEEVHRGLSHLDTAPDMARALVQSGWLPCLTSCSAQAQRQKATVTSGLAVPLPPSPRGVGDGPRQCNGSGPLLPRRLPLLPGPLFPCPTFYVFYFILFYFGLVFFFLFLFNVFFALFFPSLGPPDLAPPRPPRDKQGRTALNYVKYAFLTMYLSYATGVFNRPMYSFPCRSNWAEAPHAKSKPYSIIIIIIII